MRTNVRTPCERWSNERMSSRCRPLRKHRASRYASCIETYAAGCVHGASVWLWACVPGGVQDALVKEMKARLSAQSEDQLPHTVRGYEYFERTPVDKEHSILCRRVAGSSGGDAEVQELLDVNQLAAGTGFAEVALDLYSHDGTAMAYMVRLLRRCGWVCGCVGLLKLVGASGGHYWHGSSRSLHQGPAVWCYTPCRTSRGRCRVRGCRHALWHTVRVVLCVCGCVRVCSHVLPPGT